MCWFEATPLVKPCLSKLGQVCLYSLVSLALFWQLDGRKEMLLFTPLPWAAGQGGEAAKDTRPPGEGGGRKGALTGQDTAGCPAMVAEIGTGRELCKASKSTSAPFPGCKPHWSPFHLQSNTVLVFPFFPQMQFNDLSGIFPPPPGQSRESESVKKGQRKRLKLVKFSQASS